MYAGKRLILSSFLLLLFFSPLATAQDSETRVYLIITGLGGLPEYEETFLGWGSETQAVFKDLLPRWPDPKETGYSEYLEFDLLLCLSR